MEGNIYQVIWFILWAVLWIVYFALDGFDLGAGSLLYFLGRTPEERAKVYKAIGPFWDGNEVWLITAGGATFAAFPRTYAVMFSTLYSALLLLLFTLILRGIAVEYRNKYENPTWRGLWDLIFFINSLLPGLLLGVAFANIFKGLPIDANGILHGSFFSLLNPYGLLGGALFLFWFAIHGATWMAFRTSGELAERAASLGKKLWAIGIFLVIVFWLVSAQVTDLWNNYLKYPILFIFPAITVIAGFLIPYFLSKKSYFKAWICSGLSIVGFGAWGFAGLFPRMLPSSLNPEYSLTIYNSSSSPLTLKLMMVVALIFVPIVLAYTFWAYKTFASEKLNGAGEIEY
jgi:cytochrome d ubiquinol oxidase subunit II